jgi:peptidoglycan/xylan/chitin deacetylase (PgdA/CDA1 family)
LNRVRKFPEKTVALTFDDGPDPVNTPKILNLLKAYDAKATFFVLGTAAKRYPILMRRIAAEGHAIGNHSWSHPSKTTKQQAINQIEWTQKAIERAVGFRPKLFRPPYGIANGDLASQAKARGMTLVLWSASSGDTSTKDARTIFANVRYTPANGEIVLLHDGPGKAATVEALPKILKGLKKDKFDLVTVPQLLERWDGHLYALQQADPTIDLAKIQPVPKIAAKSSANQPAMGGPAKSVRKSARISR